MVFNSGSNTPFDSSTGCELGTPRSCSQKLFCFQNGPRNGTWQGREVVKFALRMHRGRNEAARPLLHCPGSCLPLTICQNAFPGSILKKLPWKQFSFPHVCRATTEGVCAFAPGEVEMLRHKGTNASASLPGTKLLCS